MPAATRASTATRPSGGERNFLFLVPTGSKKLSFRHFRHNSFSCKHLAMTSICHFLSLVITSSPASLYTRTQYHKNPWLRQNVAARSPFRLLSTPRSDRVDNEPAIFAHSLVCLVVNFSNKSSRHALDTQSQSPYLTDKTRYTPTPSTPLARYFPIHRPLYPLPTNKSLRVHPFTPEVNRGGLAMPWTPCRNVSIKRMHPGLLLRSERLFGTDLQRLYIRTPIHEKVLSSAERI